MIALYYQKPQASKFPFYPGNVIYLHTTIKCDIISGC